MSEAAEAFRVFVGDAPTEIYRTGKQALERFQGIVAGRGDLLCEVWHVLDGETSATRIALFPGVPKE